MIRGKTAIIMVGGAMKSVHGAGFLWSYERELGLPRPDLMIGSSGDAGNVFYYCADQVEAMRRIWIEHLTTRKFISFTRLWRIMNVDYLIDEVFKKQEPLNTPALSASATEWLVPLSDFDTGKTFYASAQDNLDPFEILRAAKAIPILFGKRVPLRHRRYIDGELGPILQDHLEEALSRGASRILIVNHSYPWTWQRSLPMRLYSRLVSAGLRDAIMRDVATDVTAYHSSEAQVLFLSPSSLPCGTATIDKAKIRATFERGAADARALAGQLRALLQKEEAPDFRGLEPVPAAASR